MKEIRNSTGADREAWRLAMQAEIDSLRNSESFEELSQSERKKLRYSEILPMKLVTGIKKDAVTGGSKKKVRAVVCGNFPPKSDG